MPEFKQYKSKHGNGQGHMFMEMHVQIPSSTHLHHIIESRVYYPMPTRGPCNGSKHGNGQCQMFIEMHVQIPSSIHLDHILQSDVYFHLPLGIHTNGIITVLIQIWHWTRPYAHGNAYTNASINPHRVHI